MAPGGFIVMVRLARARADSVGRRSLIAESAGGSQNLRTVHWQLHRYLSGSIKESHVGSGKGKKLVCGP